MTAQIGDRFYLGDLDYRIVAISKPIEFHPKKYGITPREVCSACSKGFFCAYRITEQGIFLEELYVNSQDNYYPEIEGVKPLEEEERGRGLQYMGHHLYSGLNVKIDYTGKILVGNKFLDDYYIHQGYQRAWAYEELLELEFENGELIAKNDRSTDALILRKTVDKYKEKDEIWVRESVFEKLTKRFSGKYNEKKMWEESMKFVEQSYSLDYEDKAWWLK